MSDFRIVERMPHQEYLDEPGLSCSTLKHIRPTPAHLQHYLATKDEERPSVTLIMGTLIHHAILTPDVPFPDVAVKPEDMTFRTKEGKAWKAAQEAAGRIVLGQDAWETVQRCIDGAKQSKILCDLLSDGTSELSIWHKGDFGIVKKARMDFVPARYAMLMDIKTVDDASEEAFQRKLLDFQWHMQAAWYLDIWNATHPDDQREAFVFWAIEKPTGFVAPYALHPGAEIEGRRRYQADLKTYLECERKGEWPAYPQEPVIANLPLWHYRKSYFTS